MDLLVLVDRILQSRTACAGFVRMSAADPDLDDRMGLVEYRREVVRRPPLLLDIVAMTDPPRITAELWSPGDLAHVSAASTTDDVAIRRRTWTIPPADHGVLAGEVAAEVGAWLERVGATREPGQAAIAG